MVYYAFDILMLQGRDVMSEALIARRGLQPKLVAAFEFVEWTPDNHLRHPKFVASLWVSITTLPCETAQPFF